MATNLKVAAAIANTAVGTVSTACNSGFIDIYASSQPATPETSAGGTALVTLSFGATAFGSPTLGVLTANSIAAATVANGGTALWFRATKTDHSTPVYDGNVGTSAADMIIANTTLVAGASLSISSLTFTLPGF